MTSPAVARLAGRTAIVTGAGQGVGAGIARRLAAEGADVVVAARRAETGEPVARAIRAGGGRVLCIETDVTDRAAVERCVERTVEMFGSLEIVVHNAFAGAVPVRLEDVELEEHWAPMSRTAVWPVLFLARAAWPSLSAAGAHGRLVIVSSPSAFEGSANLPLYSSVKAAQRALAKSLAREWGAAGVTVNCLAPVAESPALAGALDRNPALRSAMEARTSLGRIGDAERDIGGVAAFLASDDGGYVTGQTIVCDGGSFLAN